MLLPIGLRLHIFNVQIRIANIAIGGRQWRSYTPGRFVATVGLWMVVGILCDE